VGTGIIRYPLTALPAFLLLTGCFGIPGVTDGPVVVAPANVVAARACSEASADAKEPKAREAMCLNELGSQASRKGNVLSLKLNDGTAKTFRNSPATCNRGKADRCFEYYLTGFYPTYGTAGAYLVYEHGHEGHDFRLVNVRTGGTKKVEGVPRLAPDNSTFFVKGCYDSCSISVETMTAATNIAWEKDLGDPADWDFVRWIDNDQVAFRTTKQTEHCPRGNCEAILKRISGAWKLESAPAT
jgi:hypothetical protein